MVFYSWNVSVPANTQDSAPVSQELKLMDGILHSIEIHFPLGCHGYVKARIKQQGTIIMPVNSDSFVTGNNETITDNFDYEIKSSTQFIVELSSPTTTYQHIISIRADIEPAFMETEEQQITDYLHKIYGTLIEPSETGASTPPETQSATQEQRFIVNYSAQEGGKITITPNGQIFIAGTSLTILAVADTGYKFDHFTITGTQSGDTTTNPFVTNINSNFSIVAYFVVESPLQYGGVQ